MRLQQNSFITRDVQENAFKNDFFLFMAFSFIQQSYIHLLITENITTKSILKALYLKEKTGIYVIRYIISIEYPDHQLLLVRNLFQKETTFEILIFLLETIKKI